MVSLRSLKAPARLALAKQPETDAKTLGSLAYDVNDVVRAAVAEHKNTSPLHLAKLASDYDCCVVFRVAANPNTPPAILALMANEPRDLFWRGGMNGVAANWENAADVYWYVNKALVQNPSTPRKALNSFWRGNWQRGAIGRGRGVAIRADYPALKATRTKIVGEMQAAFQSQGKSRLRRLLDWFCQPAHVPRPEPSSAIETYLATLAANEAEQATRANDYEPTIVVQEVADRLGIKAKDVFGLISIGKLPAEKVTAGNRVGFHVSPCDLQAFQNTYNADALVELIASIPKNPNINGRVPPTKG